MSEEYSQEMRNDITLMQEEIKLYGYDVMFQFIDKIRLVANRIYWRKILEIANTEIEANGIDKIQGDDIDEINLDEEY